MEEPGEHEQTTSGEDHLVSRAWSRGRPSLELRGVATMSAMSPPRRWGLLDERREGDNRIRNQGIGSWAASGSDRGWDQDGKEDTDSGDERDGVGITRAYPCLGAAIHAERQQRGAIVVVTGDASTARMVVSVEVGRTGPHGPL